MSKNWGHWIRWHGSKKTLAPYIIPFFWNGHCRFLDVFGGSGAITMGKPISTEEVWNDLDKRLANCFRVMKDERLKGQLQKVCLGVKHDRELYEKLRRPHKRSPVMQAFAFLFQQAVSFCGIGGFSHCEGEKCRICRTLHELPLTIEVYHQRFRNVVIEELDYRKLVQRYANNQTMAYYDSPYTLESRRNGPVYEKDWTREDHEIYLDFLLQQDHRCAVSGYPDMLYFDKLHWWRYEKFQVSCRTSKYRTKRYEVLWMNYYPDGRLIKKGKK